MDYTAYLNMKKPGYDDLADIQVINQNMDCLDDAVQSVKTTNESLKEKVTMLDEKKIGVPELEMALENKLTYYNDAKQKFPITSYKTWGELVKGMEDGSTYSYNIHQAIYESYKQFMPEGEEAGMLVIMKHATDRIQVDFITHINKRYTGTVHSNVFHGWTLVADYDETKAALQTKLTYYSDAKEKFPITGYKSWGELVKNMEDGCTYSYNIHQAIYESYKQFMPENEEAGMLVIMNHMDNRVQVDFITHNNKRYAGTVHSNVFHGWTLVADYNKVETVMENKLTSYYNKTEAETAMENKLTSYYDKTKAALQTKLTYYSDAKEKFPITSYKIWGDLEKNMEDGCTYSYNINQDIYESYKQFMPESEKAGMLVIMKHATDRVQVDFITYNNKRYTGTVHSNVFHGWTLLTGDAVSSYAVTLLNGVSSGEESVQYGLSGSQVFLQGMLTIPGGTREEADLFILPDEFAPQDEEHYYTLPIVSQPDLQAVITIQKDGHVVFKGPELVKDSIVSLSGIHFYKV